MSLDELAQKYAQPEDVPNAELYAVLCEPDTRSLIQKWLKPYYDRLDQAEILRNDDERKEERDLILKAAQEELEKFKARPTVASIRYRCQTSLPWMACWFTWETNPEGQGRPISENKITEESHALIFDLFVKKDPKRKLKDQDTCKIRMLLWPRGCAKSTIDVVDTTQWIINFPSIRILYLTGDEKLAEGFVRETKGHFALRPDEPSLMNLFFPEFCFDEGKTGNVYEFSTPAWRGRKFRKEPTVQASSIGSGLGGRHYECVKADDSVYDGNSGTEEVCQGVATKISTTVRPGKTLVFGGYLDIIGTRYHDVDYYGTFINKIRAKNEPVITTGRNWTKFETANEKILIAKAIVIKSEVIERLEKEGRPVNYKEASATGCDVLLPDWTPYEALIREWQDDEIVFEGQMNQNPRPVGKIIFERNLLLKNTIRFDEIPYSGPISQTWDFAGPLSNKAGRDFTCGSNAQWNEKGQCFITEIVRDHFRPNDLAKAVVDFAKKYHPFVIGIENAFGAKWLEPSIIAEARRCNDLRVLQVCSRIDWTTPENQKGAKQRRMEAMHPLLVNGLLKFANFLINGNIEILYEEFEKIGVVLNAKNDIPDSIARQIKYMPNLMQANIKPELAARLGMSFGLSKEQAAYNLLYMEGTDCFGSVGMGVPTPMPIIAPEPEQDLRAEPMYDGVPNVLGAGL